MDEQRATGQDDRPQRRRRRLRGLLLAAGVILASVMLGALGARGPRQLADVPAAMPGVPIFPLSTIADRNIVGQYAMAAPVLMLRLQGAARVETVQLHAPGEQYFVREWYRMIAPTQQWTFVGEYHAAGVHRLLYVRQREGLQIAIARTVDIDTPVHLVYLQGMTDVQLRRLGAPVPPPPPAVAIVRPTPPRTPPAVPRPLFDPHTIYQPFYRIRDVLMGPAE